MYVQLRALKHVCACVRVEGVWVGSSGLLSVRLGAYRSCNILLVAWLVKFGLNADTLELAFQSQVVHLDAMPIFPPFSFTE